MRGTACAYEEELNKEMRGTIGGYTEELVASPTPEEYLKCGLCSHLLRNPLQIMPCGHRYCNSCFVQIETFSTLLNTPLICILDRNQVNETQVFDDTALHRIIMESIVKCSFQVSGCKWTGELKDLDDHKRSCIHDNRYSDDSKSNACTMTEDDDEFRWKMMCARMDKFDEVLNEKEVEITLIKDALKETEDKLNVKSEEVDLLKLKTDSLEREIELLKEADNKLQCKDEMISREEKKCLHGSKDDHHDHSRFIKKNEVKLLHHHENPSNISLRESKGESADDPREITCLMTMILIKSLENEVRNLQDRFETFENNQQSKLKDIDEALDELKIQMDEIYESDTSDTSGIETDEMVERRKLAADARKIAADALSDRLKELEFDLRKSLSIQSPDHKKCLEVLEDIGNLPLTPALIMRNKTVVPTMKKVRCYKANQDVCKKADLLYKNFKSMFAIGQPTNSS